MRILLIEDDPQIGDGLNRGLQKLNMAVDWFRDGLQGASALEIAPYDAVVLDLGLPNIDGLDILKQWRSKKIDTPVLILTARDAITDRVSGLNHGADDYLCKPFALDEVAARLQALVRRRQGQTSSKLVYGALELDTAAQSATLHGEELSLTSREWALLQMLVSRPKHIISRAQIEEKLYSWDQEVESNAVEVYIHHLRKKIGNEFIKTRRGLGYQLGKAP